MTHPRRRSAGRGMRAVRWVAVTVSVCALAACGPKPPPNVFLIVIDTLRADRVGWYGDDRKLTPFLDSLADGGTVFWNAYAQTSWTEPSVATIFTSRYLSQHNVIHIGSVLAPEEQTLAESLKESGYRTAAFSASPFVTRRNGLAQGFDQFQVLVPDLAEELAKARAEEINAACLRWVEQARSQYPGVPLFVYLHYMEPHLPYNPPPAVLEGLLRTRPQPEKRREWVARARDVLDHMATSLGALDADGLAGLEDLYDAEVMSLDLQLADLFGRLRAQGLLANAVVLITADHGEEFREHGRVGHGMTLYNEVTHVPLLVLTPQAHGRGDIREVVSHVDIAPMLLDYAGIAAPATFEGRSLRALLRPQHRFWRVLTPLQTLFVAPRHSASYSELFSMRPNRRRPTLHRRPRAFRPSAREAPSGHRRAVIMGARKLIVRADNQEESFDLAANPHEAPAPPLAQSEASVLHAMLNRFSTQLTRRRPEQVRPLDAETRERMRALGYGEPDPRTAHFPAF